MHAERQRTVTVVSVVLTLVVVAAYVTFSPGALGERVRGLIGADERLNPVVVAEDVPGAHHAFIATQRGSDEPVAWDPCREIRYEVNPEGAPPGWEALVEDGVAEVGARTGLELTFAGTTDDRDFTERYDPNGGARPVLIGWADEDEVPDLEEDVAGIGGATYAEVGGRRGYVSGMVVLDVDVYDQLAADGDTETQRAILLHELGHLVGLGHVDDPGEIMYADGISRTSFGPGDLQGLARLGAVPCG